jgi:hypothetical protein
MHTYKGVVDVEGHVELGEASVCVYVCTYTYIHTYKGMHRYKGVVDVEGHVELGETHTS